MPMYEITVKEVWCQKYRVYTDSKEEAIESVHEGDAEMINDDFHYSYALEDDEWEVRKLPSDE